MYMPLPLHVNSQLDSRITSMMVVGKWLWLGTGKGLVVIFNISRVPESETAIAVLTQKSSENAALTSEEASNDTGHGLLTADLAETTEIETKNVRGTGSDYYRNRRTAFGRTLRGPSMKQIKKAQQMPAVFQCQYENSYQLAQSEAVKVLLSMW